MAVSSMAMTIKLTSHSPGFVAPFDRMIYGQPHIKPLALLGLVASGCGEKPR
jgi:hypothetical protein